MNQKYVKYFLRILGSRIQGSPQLIAPQAESDAQMGGENSKVIQILRKKLNNQDTQAADGSKRKFGLSRDPAVQKDRQMRFEVLL